MWKLTVNGRIEGIGDIDAITTVAKYFMSEKTHISEIKIEVFTD